MAHSLDAARLAEQGRQIDALNRNDTGITLLKGIEVDILDDGGLDLPDDVLGSLDIVVAAVHSQFGRTQGADQLAARTKPGLSIARSAWAMAPTVFTKLSGLREIESIPCSTRNAAKSGWSLGA